MVGDTEDGAAWVGGIVPRVVSGVVAGVLVTASTGVVLVVVAFGTVLWRLVVVSTLVVSSVGAVVVVVRGDVVRAIVVVSAGGIALVVTVDSPAPPQHVSNTTDSATSVAHRTAGSRHQSTDVVVFFIVTLDMQCQEDL